MHVHGNAVQTATIAVVHDKGEEQLDLIARVARNRDREAFRTLFEHFGPRIKALMLKSGADPDQAEDLVQDVMVTVWRKVELFRPDRGSVATWIFTIARNARIDRLRRGVSRPYEDVEAMDIASEEPDGEAVTLASQRSDRVAEAMTVLPEEQRRIIEMAFVEDLAQSEIASRLDLPLGTVKSRMRLAYEKLKVSLKDLKS